MNEKKSDDEKNKILSNHFLSQSFFIVLIYIVISSLVKMAYLDWDMVYYIDTFIVVMIASGYFTIRGIQHGLFTQKEGQTNKKRVWFSHILGAVMFGVLMVWFLENETTWTGKFIWFTFYSVFFGVGTYLFDRLISKFSTKGNPPDEKEKMD